MENKEIKIDEKEIKQIKDNREENSKMMFDFGKIKLERIDLIKERRLLNRDITNTFNTLKYINSNYNPKCYVVLDKGIYYNLIIKHLGKPKSIYLGKPQSIIKKLHQHLPNLKYSNVKKFEYTLNTFFEDVIRNNMNYNKPTLNIKKLSDILNMI